MSSWDFHSCRLWTIEFSILVGYELLKFPYPIFVECFFWKPLSLSVISNNSGLSIQSNCSRTPVWISCAVDSRGSPTKSDPFSCITVTERERERLSDKLAKSWQEKGVYVCIYWIYIKGRILVPLHVRSIQTITHGKGSASIRQTERRNVLLQLILHLRCVHHFTFKSSPLRLTLKWKGFDTL